MARNANHRRLIALAALAAGLFGACLTANAASETTRRNSNAIQNYQNRQQGPYYSGKSNSYYGTSTQGGGQVTTQPVPQRPSPELQNQIRDNQRRNTGQ